MKILAPIRNGVEELELIAPVDVLRRAGAEVTIASCEETLLVRGRNGIVIQADAMLDDIDTSSFDVLLIAGGPSTAAMRADERVVQFCREYASADKFVTAICAAPLVLKDAGLLDNKRYTAHFTTAEELPHLEGQSAVVVDGKLITSRGAGTALEFGMSLVELLMGKAVADEVAAGICR